MSNRSRGQRQKQEWKWLKEKEAKRQARLRALKAAVLAPLPPKKPGELPPEHEKTPEEL